jgi:hypothetical protein
MRSKIMSGRFNPAEPRMKRLGGRLATAALLASVGMTGISAAQLADGFGSLAERLGPAMPTGAGIGLGIVEARVGDPETGAWGPNPGIFANQTITFVSGSTGVSGHADMVLSTLIQRAPGIDDVWSWEALDWLQGGFLRFGSGIAPAAPPATLRVFNHSWIAGTVDAPTGNEAMRRLDFQVNRDSSMECVGTSNGSTHNTPVILASTFNGITVGHPNGARADTPSGGFDGPGRMKPDIAVGSVGASSTATPVASAAAALLLETALTVPPLSSNVRARRAEVIKACLLAGADRTEAWTNSPVAKGEDRGRTSRPIDFGWGAGFLNVDRSHRILTGDRQVGSTTVPAATNIGPVGWDLSSVLENGSRFWRFEISEEIDELAVVATWNRTVSSNFGSWSVMDVDLVLHSVDGLTLQPLTGDDGLEAFFAGNVVSESLVDNVELLMVRGLAAGEYVIEARRKPGATTRDVAVAWIMPETSPPARPADLNGDGVVDGADLGLLLLSWGTAGEGDINGDGIVDGADLGLMLQDWG